MFTLKINGSPEPYALQEEKTFGQVMEKLSRQMTNNGKVITRIYMNDQTLVGGKQLDFYMFPLEKVDTIELITADPRVLAKDSLQSLTEFRFELIRNCCRSAELFRLGDDLEANELYARVIEGWRWLIKGINAMLGMLNVDIANFKSDGKSLAEFQSQILLPLFDRMLEAQKREDWIELADLLEFELTDSLAAWEGFQNEIEKILI